jgi:hypothetical protein
MVGRESVVAGTTLVYASLGAAIHGSFSALLPLPLAIAFYVLAVFSIRYAVDCYRSVMR